MRLDPRALIATPSRRTALAVAGAIAAAMALLDGPALRLVAMKDPTTATLMRITTQIGDSGWMLAVCGLTAAAALLRRRRSRSSLEARGLRRILEIAATAFAAVGLLGLLAAGLKLVIGRARPKMVEEAGLFGFEPLAFSFKMNSFPSGHSTTLFALAAVLVILAPRWRVAVLAVAWLGALTRVGAGAHHVSDVVAGAALGWYGARALMRMAALRGVGFDAALRPLEPALTAAAARRLVRTGMRDGLGALRRLKDWIDGRIRRGTGTPLRGGRADEERGG